jgi:hypothetical protein
MKTYEIKYEPITIEGTLYPKYNIYYSDGEKQFHSKDGINGIIREGFTDINAKNWLGLEQQLRYSALFAKAFTDATEKGLSLFMVTLVNGKSGQASENSLAFAFSVLGVTWTESEVIELNSILESNNFTIRL